MNLEQMKNQYLSSNSIKYLDYFGNVSHSPKEKVKKRESTGLITVYKYDETEYVL